MSPKRLNSKAKQLRGLALLKLEQMLLKLDPDDPDVERARSELVALRAVSAVDYRNDYTCLEAMLARIGNNQHRKLGVIISRALIQRLAAQGHPDAIRIVYEDMGVVAAAEFEQ